MIKPYTCEIFYKFIAENYIYPTKSAQDLNFDENLSTFSI